MGLFDNDNSMDDMKRAIERNRRLYEQIDLPEYQEYVPELYSGESANYDLTAEDPTVKSDQMSLLKKLAGLAETGQSAEDEAGFAQAAQVGNQMAKGNREAAIQDAQNRGVSGGGLEFAMREVANQGGAQRAQELGLNQTAQSSNKRMQALQAYSQGLGGVRDQDYRANSGNTDIINKFNQANTQQRNAYGNANVDQRNQAFQYNEGLKDKNYQNQIGKTDRIAGMNNQAAEMTAAQAEADRKRRAALAGIAGAGIGAAAGGPAGASVGYGIGSNLG